MIALPVTELLAPVGDVRPCGANLEYTPAFRALEQASEGKPEQQYGDTLIAAQEPDWRAVYEQALDLARQTRDLRIAVMLARASAHHLGGLAYLEALGLVAGLLEVHWGQVHPQLDHDDNDDPTMRVNALLPLVDAASGLADLRAANLGEPRTPLTVRHVELASGKAAPHEHESMPTPEGVIVALVAANTRKPGLLDALVDGPAVFKRIEENLEAKLGSGQAPDLRPLGLTLKCLAAMAFQAQQTGSIGDPPADASALAPTAAKSAPPRLTGGSKELAGRDEVVHSLELACEWIERNEPTNPAPLLIRRAQRLMNKNFLDIIRDLAPAGLPEVENIAGSVGS